MTFRTAALCIFCIAIVFSSLSVACAEETAAISPKDGVIKYYVNGVLAIEAFDADPCSGKIALQLEEAELDFRRFELHPLTKSKQLLSK